MHALTIYKKRTVRQILGFIHLFCLNIIDCSTTKAPENRLDQNVFVIMAAVKVTKLTYSHFRFTWMVLYAKRI